MIGHSTVAHMHVNAPLVVCFHAPVCVCVCFGQRKETECESIEMSLAAIIIFIIIRGLSVSGLSFEKPSCVFRNVRKQFS